MVKDSMGKKGFIKNDKPFLISGVYLFNSNGFIISNIDFPTHSNKDADIFSSMLTAIKMFITDSSYINSKLKDIEYGSFKILVEEGKDFFLVIIGKGDYTRPFRREMKKVVEGINDKFGVIISNWNGKIDEFQGIDKELNKLIKPVRST